MNKLEGTETSEEQALAALPLNQWTFDEPPRTKRAKKAGTMLLSSAGSHYILMPPPQEEYMEANARKLLERKASAKEHAPYPTFGAEHDNDVDYGADSPNEEGNITLESPSESNADQEKPSDKGKEEAEPEAIVNMGAGTIAKRNAVLTQAIVLDLAATKQIKLHTSILDYTQQQAGLEDIYNYVVSFHNLSFVCKVFQTCLHVLTYLSH
jgi:hypothetical protein